MRNEKNTVLVKAKTFAIRIVKLFAFLRKEKKDFILSKQILRSGTSIGANLAEAEFAVSEKDFLKFKAKSDRIEFKKHEKSENVFDKGSFPYYIYVNRHRNGGGITLRYDAKTGKMTGSYSHH